VRHQKLDAYTPYIISSRDWSVYIIIIIVTHKRSLFRKTCFILVLKLYFLRDSYFHKKNKVISLSQTSLSGFTARC
jgi:hypothetical protein